MTKAVSEDIAVQAAVHFVTDSQFVFKCVDDLDYINRYTIYFFSDLTQNLGKSQLSLPCFKRYL